MRAALIALALFAAACPPLSDDYEIVGTGGAGIGAAGSAFGGADGEAGSGGVGGAGGSSGSGAMAGSAGSGGDSGADAGDAGCGVCDASCCSGACVDVLSDPNHCGACGSACPKGRACNFGKCSSGWVAMSATSFAPREKAAHAWTGSRMFIFAGADAAGVALGDSALYDPMEAQQSGWTLIPAGSGAPSPRILATALDLGGSVLVMGGGDAAGTADYADGAIFDLTSKTWQPVPDAPKARRAPVMARKGEKVLLWGGWDSSNKPVAGTHVLDLGTKVWTTVSTEPSARSEFAWANSADELYVYGGRVAGTTKSDEAHRATITSGVWSAAGKGPSGRYASFGAWDGTRFWVWGGRDDNNAKADGAAYQGTWSALATTGAPAARAAPPRHTGWSARVADQVVLLVGGMTTTGTYFRNGGIYDASAATPKWTSVGDWPSSEDHAWGAAVWTGQELVVWGGRTGTALTSKGVRYQP